MNLSLLKSALREFWKVLRHGVREMSGADALTAENKRQNAIISEMNTHMNKICAALSEIQGDLKNIGNGTMCSLRNDILHLTEKYTRQGSIPPIERRNLASLHEAYTALGGNSYEHDEYERTMNLPIK